MKVAILDDYQNVALKMADWSAPSGRAEITVFTYVWQYKTREDRDR
ncbi:MAG TPA: hypothetical protein VNO32_04605 [Candidatus Acidoferrum sp.]|jgi:hypothetical protein|nr:hypothetical protein [Candidatus Acidoferrum sp.]